MNEAHNHIKIFFQLGKRSRRESNPKNTFFRYEICYCIFYYINCYSKNNFFKRILVNQGSQNIYIPSDFININLNKVIEVL